MSMGYADVGRTAQKQRTRAVLVTAAQDLVARGRTPTVDEAAAGAGVSRTTAYRYFPNQQALLGAAHPETAASSLLPTPAPADLADRLDAVVTAFCEIVVATEQQQRTMLRLSLADDGADVGPLPLRQGRAVTWFTEALEPLRPALGDDDVRRLALALRSAVGIESLVWLTDVGGLSRAEAVETMRGTARALLHSRLVGLAPD